MRMLTSLRIVRIFLRLTTGPSSTAEVGYSIYLSPMFHAHVTRSPIQSPNENLYSIVNLHNIENLHDIKNLGRGFSLKWNKEKHIFCIESLLPVLPVQPVSLGDEYCM